MKLTNKFIDIDFFPTRNLMYTGFCIKHTKRIIILINFDKHKKTFDGYSVFKSEEINKYRLWNKKDEKNIKNKNLQQFVNLKKLAKMKTFYSVLNSLEIDEFIAVFTKENLKEYDVGKILKVGKEFIHLKYIDKKGNWIRKSKLKISKINFFSFLTKYEKTLKNNAA